MIEACNILHAKGIDFSCRIIGEGSYRDELERLIDKYNLAENINLLGSMPQEKIKDELANAGMFVLASVKSKSGNMDGIPVALMEAMASGVPVISTRISGITELIDNGKNGYLVESGDAKAPADILLDKINNYDKVAELTKMARKKIEDYFSLDSQSKVMAKNFRRELK